VLSYTAGPLRRRGSCSSPALTGFGGPPFEFKVGPFWSYLSSSFGGPANKNCRGRSVRSPVALRPGLSCRFALFKGGMGNRPLLEPISVG
jgi:hypothetical protein